MDCAVATAEEKKEKMESTTKFYVERGSWNLPFGIQLTPAVAESFARQMAEKLARETGIATSVVARFEGGGLIVDRYSWNPATDAVRVAYDVCPQMHQIQEVA